MKILDVLRRVVRNSDRTSEALGGLVVGLDNHARLTHDKLQAVIAGVANQSDLINRKLEEVVSSSGASNATCATSSRARRTSRR